MIKYKCELRTKEKRKGMLINIEKNEKAITLIALIITIIILLILATIAIATLTGENGLLKKILKAKEETEIQAYYERIELIRNELRLQNSNYEPPKLEQMKSEFETNQRDWVKDIKCEKINDIDTIILTTEESYQFHVTENGTKYMAKGEITKATDPKITVQSLDTTNCVRKTQIYFADLFKIEWASDGEGKVEYVVNRQLGFQK